VRQAVYRAGDVIFAEGDYSTEAYIVTRGRVEVYVTRGAERRLALLHEGAVFGELALLTDQVRTASVRAVDDTSLVVITQDSFMELWRRDPEALLPLLRVVFERVRDIVTLANELSVHDDNRVVVSAHQALAESVTGHAPVHMPHVSIEGVTTIARESLRDAPLVVSRFPFRIGAAGESDRLFANNDLVLRPREDAAVARHHCMLVAVDGRCFLIDRGSRMGTFVDGARVGGPRAPARVELRAPRSDVSVAGPRSPYRFQVTVGAPAPPRS
jgi:CRP-like cAMP-binding protein